MSTGNNSLKTYKIGQNPTATALFTNSSNTPTDPTTVTFQITDPTGLQTDYASPHATITHSGTGTFIFTYPGTTGLQIAGQWSWRVKGVGALIDSDDGTWDVEAATVATP